MRKKSWARRLIPWAFAAMAIASLVIFVGIPLYGQQETEEIEPPQVSYYEGDGKPLTMENDSLLFEMDPATTRFRVTDKGSGKVWTSNPEDAEKDPVARQSVNSQIFGRLDRAFGREDGAVSVPSDEGNRQGGVDVPVRRPRKGERDREACIALRDPCGDDRRRIAEARRARGGEGERDVRVPL